jgi:hypothetical protein
VLGLAHPLTRATLASEAVVWQLVVVVAALVGGIVGLARDAQWARAVTLSSAVVLVGLAVVAAAVGKAKRDRAIDLVLEGRDELLVGAVQRQLLRLSAARTQRAVARTIDVMIDQALHPPGICALGARPLFDTAVVASVAADLRAISRLLRTGDAPPRGVGLTERLLSDGRSPFYGDQAPPLRDELRHIHSVLRDQPLSAEITRRAGPQR